MANCVVLYNVFEMSRILHELAQEGYQVTPEAINGMNPYGTGHIIRLRQYDVWIAEHQQVGWQRRKDLGACGAITVCGGDRL